MRETMWIYGIILLLVAAVWSKSGINLITSVTSNSTTPSPIVHVTRNATFNLSSNAKLMCNDATWNKMQYVLWFITLERKVCQLNSAAGEQRAGNTCNDGKVLQNTSNNQSYLHIPNISIDDEGVYKCEVSHIGGSDVIIFHVSVSVQPSLSAWVEWQGSKRVAVCKAEKGRPAASVVWRNLRNSSFAPEVKTHGGSDGSYTVESNLELTNDSDSENLTCAVSHVYWKEEQILELNTTKAGHHGPLSPGLITLRVIVLLLLFAVFVGFIYFAQKALIRFRHARRSTSSPSKTPPPEDVEEVEPYASYMQRVNSIYNTPADVVT